MSLPEAEILLRKVLRSIEPSASQRQSAARSHGYARQVLASTPFGQSVVGSRLIGSYARHTAIAPIDDIDVLLELDRAALANAWFSSRPDPEKIIADLQRAAKTGYPRSRVQRQRRSVGIVMSKQSIDLVPAIPTSNQVFLIPDRKEREWVRTDPDAHTSRVRELNAKNEKRFVPLVKLVKHWNAELPQTASLKSIAIESIAGRLFANHQPQSLSQGLLWFFDFILQTSGVFGPESSFRWPATYGVSFSPIGAAVPGLSTVDTNIVEGMSWARSKRFVDKARIARDRLERIAEQPTARNTAREIGELMKVDFR